VLSIINANPSKVDGIKISLLDQAHEEAFRRRLPDDVRLYTGDDFNYADLIAGDGVHYSHALLGIFAAIAPAAAQALEALAEGDMETYHRLFAPTVPLSREIFRAPTRFYKAGIAFLSWLNGYQTHFIMPAGFQSSRDIVHYAEVFRLADRAGLLSNPELAVKRMRVLLALHGIE
jgi:dihydrodipicolinate synthase/N-acetylneuraminate lyase